MIKISPVSDEKDYIGFLSIAKHGGVWKSHAQRQFWFKCTNLLALPESAQHRAVGAQEGDLVVQFHGTMRWADYGARSIIPVLIYVVLDQVGKDLQPLLQRFNPPVHALTDMLMIRLPRNANLLLPCQEVYHLHLNQV
jgi:hypothetical protein